jgi:hypothetical protein
VTFALTCFGSRKNHHQGAVLCLAKPTNMVFYSARRYRRSQCYGGISACCAGVRIVVEDGTELSTGLLPDDGSRVNQNMSEQTSQF